MHGTTFYKIDLSHIVHQRRSRFAPFALRSWGAFCRRSGKRRIVSGRTESENQFIRREDAGERKTRWLSAGNAIDARRSACSPGLRRVAVKVGCYLTILVKTFAALYNRPRSRGVTERHGSWALPSQSQRLPSLRGADTPFRPLVCFKVPPIVPWSQDSVYPLYRSFLDARTMGDYFFCY